MRDLLNAVGTETLIEEVDVDFLRGADGGEHTGGGDQGQGGGHGQVMMGRQLTTENIISPTERASEITNKQQTFYISDILKLIFKTLQAPILLW